MREINFQLSTLTNTHIFTQSNTIRNRDSQFYRIILQQHRNLHTVKLSLISCHRIYSRTKDLHSGICQIHSKSRQTSAFMFSLSILNIYEHIYTIHYFRVYNKLIHALFTLLGKSRVTRKQMYSNDRKRQGFTIADVTQRNAKS